MRSKKFILKTIAVFLAINITTQVLAPTVALALTSGPTTPEVSSFEPVDTTDMVNLPTGDFTYNMPLLEVPGPEGGYPVTLSNHGGVLPNQDASWVGLGWNLNPGAINRTPNNFADDYSGASYTIRDSWNGGTTTNYSLGVGVGFDDVLAVGVNVGIQHDTYKGTSGTLGIQVIAGIEGTNLGVGIGFEEGTNGSSTGSVFVLSNSTGIALSLTESTDGGQSYTNVSLSAQSTQSSMGVTLSGGSTKFSVTPTTMFVGNNARSGEISTHKAGFNVVIPIESFYISLGYKYCRYWSSTQESTSLYGVLNGKAGNTAAFAGPGYIGNGVSYDCAVLKDPSKGYADQTDMNWCANASAPCYDNYMVTGQGISGSIEPTILDNGTLFRADVEDVTHNQDGSVSDNTMHFQSAFPRNFTKTKQFFRFLNDFSNSHVITPTNFSLNPDNTPHLTTADLAYTVNNLDTRGYIKTLDANNNVTEARFAGSKHVEYYTNAEITANTAKANGFINTQNVPLADRINKIFPYGPKEKIDAISAGKGDPTTTPSVNVANNIGGYTITNEKGVSYHYALPVYTYNFYQCMENDSYGVTLRQIYNESPYAYTWLLTAVTGPDYIDANQDGFANPGDWGYWVNFDYGKFQANAGFRTPETGKGLDIEGSTIYSKGAKEIYYLDAISTRTHTALFIKDLRSDGKGTNGFDYESFMTNFTSHIQNGGINSNTYPATNALKLSEIILIENSKLPSVFSTYNPAIPDLKACIKNKTALNCASSISNCDCIYNGRPDYEAVYGQAIPSSFTSFSSKWTMQSLWYNVIDMADMAVTPILAVSYLDLLRINAQKEVRFSYDYSLCPNTVNSFDSDPNVLKGKLTLNSVRFYGKGGVQLMPSTNFGYNGVVSANNITIGNALVLSQSSDANGNVTYVTNNSIWGITVPNTSGFAVGDIITFTATINGAVRTFYATLTSGSVASGFAMYFFGSNIPDSATYFSAGTVANASETKNPPYVSNFTDLWGFFKSDYISGSNYNKSHTTSDVSAKAVDCWSLRSIQTPTGATINMQYESDDYSDAVLKNYSINNVNLPAYRRSLQFIDFYALPLGYIYSLLNAPNSYQQWDGPMYHKFTLNDPHNIKLNDKVKIVASMVYQTPIVQTLPRTITCQTDFFQTATELQVVNVRGADIVVYDPDNKIFPSNGWAPNTNIPGNGTASDLYTAQSTIIGAYIVPIKSSVSKIPGGGLRTSVISVTDGITTKATTYQYGNASNSFGATAYEPTSMDELTQLPDQTYPLSINYYPDQFHFPLTSVVIPDWFKKKYQNSYYESYNNIIAYAKELVAPGVLYRNVIVKNSVSKYNANNLLVTTPAPAYQSYQFQTFTDDMVQQPSDVLNFQYPNGIGETNILRTTGIINNTAGIGNLLSIKTYDKNNNLLSGVSNTYTSTPPNNQGRIDQVFNEQRKLNPHGDVVNFAVVTMKTELPSVLQSTTTRDYVKGISRTTSNTAFDFYSGEVTETQTVDANGNTIISVIEPAYNYYPATSSNTSGTSTAGMGLKLYNTQNSHMLSQKTASYTLKKAGISNYSCTVTPTGNGGESQVTNLSGVLPLGYHIGSTITLPTGTAYITSIAADRMSFKMVGVTNYGTINYLQLNASWPLSVAVCTWNNMWNYRANDGIYYNTANYNKGTSYIYTAMTDNTNTVQNENVWRQKSNYVWNYDFVNPDGYPMSSPVPFDFRAEYLGGVPAAFGNFWQKLNTNTLFSIYSKPLESMDVNGKYSATKFCNGESSVLATAANASYSEFTQCGAEYTEPNMIGYAEGEMLLGGAQPTTSSTNIKHTGVSSFMLGTSTNPTKYSLSYTSGAGYQSGFTAGKNYRASVWVYAPSYVTSAQLYATTVDNGTSTIYTASSASSTTIKCGNWYLLSLTFPAPATAVSSNSIVVGVKNTGGSGVGYIYFDDFRFQPDVSSVTSYVYDQSTGLVTYIIGNDNRYTRYQYDSKNKLKAVFKETSYGEIKVSEHNYNYSRPTN